MGFFGLALEKKKIEEVDIPQGWHLRLCNAVLDPANCKKGSAGPTTVMVRVGEEDEASGDFALCHVDPEKCIQFQCTMVFNDVDSPVFFWTSGTSTVHLTGCFERDPYAGGEDGDSEEGSEEDSEEDDDDISDDEMLDRMHEHDMMGGNGDMFAEIMGIMGARGGGPPPVTRSKGIKMLEDVEELPDVSDEEEKAESQANNIKAKSGKDVKKTEPAEKSGKKRKLQTQEPETAVEKEEVEEESASKEAGAADAPAVEKSPAEKRKEKKRARKQKIEQEKAVLAEAFADPVTKAKADASKKGSSASPANGKQSGAAKTSERYLKGGLKVTDTVIGDGKAAALGKEVKIFYEGSFPDGRVFDKNFNRKKPLTFRVGHGGVIKGMDRGIEGMKVGGTRQLHIPAALAYGKGGAGPIGPNQDLVFSIELLEVSGR